MSPLSDSVRLCWLNLNFFSFAFLFLFGLWLLGSDAVTVDFEVVPGTDVRIDAPAGALALASQERRDLRARQKLLQCW